jgi:hypothetical protein
MGLFSKKEKVPEVEASADVDKENSLGDIGAPALPELPSFPSSPANDSLNQEIVKSAVGDELPDSTDPAGNVEPSMSTDASSPGLPGLPKEEPSEIPNLPASSTEASVPKVEPSEAVSPSVAVDAPAEVSVEPSVKMSSVSASDQPTKGVSIQSTGSEPIFVRLDKFQDSQKIFKEIRETVTDIEDVLGKIKGVKSKEETELNGWTKEVESLKRKLSEIDSEIFNQI